MKRVMTAREYAEFTGRDLADVEAMIAEAESDAITRDTMDASTLVRHNWTAGTEEKFRRFMRAVGRPAPDAHA